ncbi:MAG: hemerythrin domain-containing protein [Desulfobacterales bacterium]
MKSGETMERYLNTPIKEIITRFPKVGEILEEYNIGCVPCNVGSCLFKDIMEIHNLSEEDEQVLMRRIAKVIYPDKEVSIPKIKRKRRAGTGEITYSPPIKKLVDEHTVIKKLLALIPYIIENIDVKSKQGREIVNRSVDFIRNYADKYHHAKEEEILFKYFDENLDILDVMHQDHESARGHVRAILEALDKKDKNTVAEHLNAYQELLDEHIKKENEILYPWMDRNLSVSQVGELFAKFNEVEEAGSSEVVENCKKFVESLEEKYKNLKKEAVK